MAFTCGFFNSQNGDRKYNAEQMASIFDGLIKDGVYDTVGDIFAVTPGTGMQVLVGSGRAWFDHTWNNNDSPYPLAITAADVSLPRYDAVVLETNHSDTVRTNRLRVLTGTPASNPAKPTMTSTANVKQHPLAYIKVTAGATAIKQSMIQVVVGTSECPFVTGIIDTAQIDALFQQWNGEFNEWFENLKAQLSDNVVANLQGQIDRKVAKADVATAADIEAGTSTTKWVSPKGLRDSGNVGEIGDLKVTKNPNQSDNWLYANSQLIDRVDYPKLPDVIHNTLYGGTNCTFASFRDNRGYMSTNGGQACGVFNVNNKLTVIKVYRFNTSQTTLYFYQSPNTFINSVDEFVQIHQLHLPNVNPYLGQDFFLACYLVYFKQRYYLYVSGYDQGAIRLYMTSAESITALASSFTEVMSVSEKSYTEEPFITSMTSDGDHIYLTINNDVLRSDLTHYPNGGGLYRSSLGDLSDISYVGRARSSRLYRACSFGSSKIVCPIDAGDIYIDAYSKSDLTRHEYQITTSILNNYPQLKQMLGMSETGVFDRVRIYDAAIHENTICGFIVITYKKTSSSSSSFYWYGVITFSKDDLSDLSFYPLENSDTAPMGYMPISRILYADGFVLVVIGGSQVNKDMSAKMYSLQNGVYKLVYNQIIQGTNPKDSYVNPSSVMKRIHGFLSGNYAFDGLAGIIGFDAQDDGTTNASTQASAFVIVSISNGSVKFRVPTLTDENGYVFIKGR